MVGMNLTLTVDLLTLTLTLSLALALALLHGHAQQRGDDRARPRAGARCWDADEERKGEGARLARGERVQLALRPLEQRRRHLQG